MKYTSRLVFLLFISNAIPSFAQQTITISPLDKNHIQVEYKLPKECKEASLQERYEGRAASLRKDWKAMDNCSVLTNGDTLTLPKNCSTSRFSVPMSTAFIDRVEPFAYPMDDLGVRIHTGTFGLNNKCGTTTWVFKSPKGSVVDESGIYTKQFKASLNEKNYLNYTGIYLSYKHIPKNRQQVFTKNVPAELAKTINDGQQLLSDYYKKNYSSIPFNRPFLLVDNIPDQNGFGAQAEVTSPHMIRIGYVGWSTKNILDTQFLQAHEYAHLLQSRKNAPSSHLFNEGGAEFISLMASYHLGWINKQTFSENISSAIQSCISLSDNKQWDHIKNAFGRIPYDCGLVMHLLALANRHQSDSAEQVLEKYYLSNQDDTHFASAIECGSQPECAPTFMAEFMGNQKPISSVITTTLDQLKLVTQISYASPNDHTGAAMRAAFSTLMMEDCNGTDFYTQQNYFQTGDMLVCKNLPKKGIFTSVDGINYFSHPNEAIDAQNIGCGTKQKITLSDDKALKLEIPCTKLTAKTYYSIDTDKLLAILERRTAQ